MSEESMQVRLVLAIVAFVSAAVAADLARAQEYTSRPDPPLPLSVEADGEPLVIRSMLAWTAGDQWVEVFLSNVERRTCEDISSGHMRRAAPEEKSFSFRLNRQYRQGSLHWMAFSGSRGGSLIEVDSLDVHSLDASPGGRVAATVDLSFAGMGIQTGASEIHLWGTLDATPCGDHPGSWPPARPQAVVVTINGEEVEMQGAVLVEEYGRRSVSLSSQPMSCLDDSRPLHGDLALTIDLIEGRPGSDRFGVGGDLFEGSRSIRAHDRLLLDITDVTDGAEQWTATVSLAEPPGRGRGTPRSLLFDGVEVTINGRIDAERCEAGSR